MHPVSVPNAIRRGFAMAYGLFFPFIAGVPLFVFLLAKPLNLPDFFLLLSVPLGILAAWLWWSYRIPQWRLWALQHVEDIDALHQRAVQVGIEWPYGHLFERTEIKSHQHARREATLQLQYYLNRTDNLFRTTLADSSLYRTYNSAAEQIQNILISDDQIALDLISTLEDVLKQLRNAGNGGNLAFELYQSLASTSYAATKYRRSTLGLQAASKAG
jgi:hypothetical protein